MGSALELTLDPEENRKGRPNLFAELVFLVLLVHLVLLYLFPWQKNEPVPLKRQIEVTLKPTIQAVTVKTEPIQQQVIPAPTRELSIDSVAPVETVQPAKPEEPATLLLEQILNFTRGIAREPEPDQTSTMTFSTKDFPSARPRSTARPKVRHEMASTGAVTERVVTASGKEYCYQQRGDPFDRNTWVWARVPIELCGHL